MPHFAATAAVTHMASQLLARAPRFFVAPDTSSGRRIRFGFSYLQRIGKTAATDFWLPESLAEQLALRIAAGDTSVLDTFHVEWAAVRQFELLQEAGNLAIEDLEVGYLTRSFQYLMKMRAGGYRVTVITLGDYVEADRDELAILDQRLQAEITQLIHMIYLESQSGAARADCTKILQAGTWRCQDMLPHIAERLAAMRVFNWAQPQDKLQQRFFELLALLPQNQITHDVAVGLSLPEASKQNSWIYIAKAEHQLRLFQQALTDVFRGFDHINLGKLQGRGDAPSEIKATMGFMRGYGDHLRQATALNPT